MWLRVVVLLGLAAAVGFGTIKLARQWLATERAAQVTSQGTVSAEAPVAPVAAVYVLVAGRDLGAGMFLTDRDIRWQAWPDETLAPGYLVKDEHDPASLIGAVVRSRIAAGEPVTAQRVARPGDRGFLAAVLNPGMRAVAVPVNERSGLAGLIFPGDRVDVILSHQLVETSEDSRTSTLRNVSETVLHDLRVLAIDQTTNDQATDPHLGKTVSLEVTPQQAEAIAVVLQLGTVSLSLRSLAGAGHPVARAEDPADGAAGWADHLLTLVADRSRAVAPPARPPVADPPAGVTPLKDRPTYTLDSDISQLLQPPRTGRRPEPPAQAAAAPPEPEVAVYRGSADPTARN
jgi:pilus assembly protein CpaB